MTLCCFQTDVPYASIGNLGCGVYLQQVVLELLLYVDSQYSQMKKERFIIPAKKLL